MKRITLFAIVCCTVLFSSCYKPQETYTTKTVYTIEDPANEISLKAVLGTVKSYWDGSYTFSGMEQGICDLKATTKYLTSVTGILSNGNDIKKYLEDGDSFTYTLTRDSDNKILVSTKFYKNADGYLDAEEIVSNVESFE